MRVYPDMFSLTGRTAIVTGAGSGIGAHVALALAQAGSNIVAVDMDLNTAQATADAAIKLGVQALAIQTDVAQSAAVSAMVEKAVQKFGNPQILINSAGVTKRTPAVDFLEADWDRIIAINLKGSFLCAQAFGRKVLESGGASIVNIASIAGLAGFGNTVAYQSSKGGVVQMTRALAAEWGRHDITVNAIAPGVVMTPMQERLRKDDPAKFDTFLGRMAISKPCYPEDIAAAALYLCSPAARFVTGHTLPVDGGYVAM